MQEIIAERDEDVAQTVESAASCVAEKEKKYASSLPSKPMLEAVKAATGYDYREIVEGVHGNSILPLSSCVPSVASQQSWSGGSQRGSEQSQNLHLIRATQEADQTTPSCGHPSYSGGEIDTLLWEWGSEIESLFDDFPLLRDVCSGLKRSQYPAALFVAGGMLMTLMTRCWYRFYHRPQQERRLNCSLYIIGHPASNKSMADDIYKILSAPMVAADKAGKAALNRYKQDLKKKAANKEGKDKPQGIIRIHPARTSNGQLIQDMLNAKETIELDGLRLSPHFTLGELTKTSYHTLDGNNPSHEAIENLKNLCENWLEDLRYSYNTRYGDGISPPKIGGVRGGLRSSSAGLLLQGRKNKGQFEGDQTTPSCGHPIPEQSSPTRSLSYSGGEVPIVISSGYRSEAVNMKCGGAKGSNHLTGCAVDIRCYGPEHMIRMAGILLDIADGTKREFDELIQEKRGTTYWIHFAVRPKNNRRKILFDCR